MHALLNELAASTHLPIQITPTVTKLFKQHNLDRLLEDHPKSAS